MKKDSVVLRIVFITAIIIVLLIPLLMIQSLINERQNYRYTAIREVAASWANAQTLGGPILTIAIKKEKTNEKGKKYFTTSYSHFLPENLFIDTEVTPEKRYKGIYEIILYKTKIKMKGNFNLQSINELLKDKDFESSFVSFNITDLKGIQKNVVFKWNDKIYDVVPGIGVSKLFNSGITAEINPVANLAPQNFELEIYLNGIEQLNFIPLGKTTEVNLKSTWNNPSFAGAFLPSSREISKDGFSAKWIVNHFNRDYPQEWGHRIYDTMPSAMGVKFILPVDQYQKTMRTSKYGLMLIVLTFLSFFMIEIFSKKVIHPIQYLLVGLALLIFYSVLLSVSEYISFQLSYILAATIIIGLIAFYVKSIYQNYKIGFMIGGLLTMFYAFMYVILQLQDYSLLLGNIALLIILATIMFSTRKINWYELFKNKTNI